MQLNNHQGKANTSSELLKSQAHIWNHIFNFINSMSLKCAIQLNIPDIIHAHAGPMTLSDLLQALAIDLAKAPHVYRLMRILTNSGFFVMSKLNQEFEEEEEGYLPTPSCKLLLKDEPGSVRPFLLAMLDPALTEPWHNLSPFLKNSYTSAFETANHGITFWNHLGNNKKLGGLFDDAMASDAALIGKVIVKECGRIFEGLKSVIDVGGGTGTLAKTLAGAFPEIEWSVLDLQQVVAAFEGGKNLKFVSGDMFDSIPNSHAVLLKWILHDWSDEECLKILKKCKEAIPSKDEGGKVIIIDMVVDNHNLDKESAETQLFFDMLMMVLVTGRERTENDWNKLFIDAGFTAYKITPIGLRSIIEVYPA